ncbi:hypothetical protein DYQ86_03050 [Acidobacteria bacterium AB60]|nr:hypothetical protein DYQ86_03050 [Acidobacteria bacterium AB60]
MRRSPTLLAAFVCVLAAGVVSAQNAATSLAHIPAGNLHFSYDAQHGSVNATGVQIRPAVQSSAIPPTTGTVSVAINISAVSRFSRDTRFHCSLTLIGGILDLNNAAVVGGIETANGIATSSGPGAATCTLTIPYSWTIPPDPAASSGLVMAFGVSAVSFHEGEAVVHRSTLQVDGIENLPPSGSNQTFAFNVTL